MSKDIDIDAVIDIMIAALKHYKESRGQPKPPRVPTPRKKSEKVPPPPVEVPIPKAPSKPKKKKKPTVKAHVMKNNAHMRIPKEYHHMIDEVDRDTDGYWIYTAKGFYASGVGKDCHTINEQYQKDALEQIKLIKPCKCPVCLGTEV